MTLQRARLHKVVAHMCCMSAAGNAAATPPAAPAAAQLSAFSKLPAISFLQLMCTECARIEACRPEALAALFWQQALDSQGLLPADCLRDVLEEALPADAQARLPCALLACVRLLWCTF